MVSRGPLFPQANGISTMTRELTRGRSTHPEGSWNDGASAPAEFAIRAVFRLFKSLDSRHIYSCAYRVGYTPVCKCKLRLPEGAIPSPDRLTRPAELRLGVINVETQSKTADRTWYARPRLYIAIVKTRLVNFIKKEETRIPLSPGT